MARRAKNNASGTGSVRLVAHQYFTFTGKSVESVEVDGSYLIVSKKPPRRSKFMKYRFPIGSAVAYREGEGGKGGSYAVVKTSEDLTPRPITGDLEVGDGYVNVTDADGNVHTFQTPEPGSNIEVIITEDSDAEPRASSKKKGGKPAKKSRAVVEDDEEEEEEAADDEDEDEDEDEDAEEEEEEAPRKKSSKAAPAKGKAAKAGKGKAAPAKGKGKPAPAPAKGKGKAAPAKGRKTVADW